MNKGQIEELKLCLESNILSDKSGMFEIIFNILSKCSDTLYKAERFKEIFSPYLLIRYLSMREDLFFYAEYLSTVYSTSKLSNIDFYKLSYRLIPKQKNTYIRYIKKIKFKKDLDNKKIINNNIKFNLMEI